MKPLKFIIIFGLVVVFNACKQTTTSNGSPYNESRELVPNPEGYKKDSFIVKSDTTVYNSLRFKNVRQVVKDKKSTTWVKSNNDSLSCILHFNLDSSQTVAVEITPECWAYFPVKIVDERITVLWDTNIDTKYNFPIVKAIHKLGQSHKDKPFMILELINDSSLKVFYPNRELKENLNKSDKYRVLFPDVFVATQLR